MLCFGLPGVSLLNQHKVETKTFILCHLRSLHSKTRRNAQSNAPRTLDAWSPLSCARGPATAQGDAVGAVARRWREISIPPWIHLDPPGSTWIHPLRWTLLTLVMHNGPGGAAKQGTLSDSALCLFELIQVQSATSILTSHTTENSPGASPATLLWDLKELFINYALLLWVSMHVPMRLQMYNNNNNNTYIYIFIYIYNSCTYTLHNFHRHMAPTWPEKSQITYVLREKLRTCWALSTSSMTFRAQTAELKKSLRSITSSCRCNHGHHHYCGSWFLYNILVYI